MDHKVEHRIDAFETLVLEKTLEIPLDCREIKPVNGKRNFYAYLLTYTYILVPNYLRVGSMYHQASQVALVVKNLPASAEDIRDPGSINGSGRFPGGMTAHLSILAWRIPRTEEPGGLQSIRSQRARQN